MAILVCCGQYKSSSKKKNLVRRTWFFKLDISKIKWRWIGGVHIDREKVYPNDKKNYICKWINFWYDGQKYILLTIFAGCCVIPVLKSLEKTHVLLSLYYLKVLSLVWNSISKNVTLIVNVTRTIILQSQTWKYVPM